MHSKEELLAEYQRQLAMSKDVPLDKLKCPTMLEMANMGAMMWPHTYKNTQDDSAAYVGYLREAELINISTGGRCNPVLPAELVGFVGAARWRDCGYPRVELGHKYAAALMATSMSPDVASLVHPPWPAFVISIPDKLLSVEDPHLHIPAELRYVLVHVVSVESGIKWNYIANSDKVATLWSHGYTLDRLMQHNVDDPEQCWADTVFGDVTDADVRTDILLRRLILGVCLAMADEQTPKKARGVKFQADMPKQVEPTLWTFQLGKPIKLDCREEISDFLHGRRSTAPSVRTLVRGHWKSQPHGPQKSLRKPIWLEPYWRGNEGAPIVVRPTMLKTEEG